ncbi:uncharacterized protein LOC131878714 [Tigriopus californicus]|uniref:uncharacterized protein LOC131878714 n=1 Tax=Tigriopus californicus TaxID=6832 RepID=UPI0027DAA53D|nr:uncharacterized protein LOC131878714 [Tigriopus californicus]
MVVLNPMVSVYEKVEMWENYSFYQRFGRRERHWTYQRYLPKRFPVLFKTKFGILYFLVFFVFIWKILLCLKRTSKCQKLLLVVGLNVESEVWRFYDESFRYSDPSYSKAIEHFLIGVDPINVCFLGFELNPSSSRNESGHLSQKLQKCGLSGKLTHVNDTNYLFHYFERLFRRDVWQEVSPNDMVLIVRPGRGDQKSINGMDVLSNHSKAVDKFFHHVFEIYPHSESNIASMPSLDWTNTAKKLSLDDISSKEQTVCIDKKKPR